MIKMEQKQSSDWNCRACNHLNFGWRNFCQRCAQPSSKLSASDLKPGDWYCFAGGCGAHNFKFRSTCYRCNVSKDDQAAGGQGGGGGGGCFSNWKPGDWLCARNGCNWHNFASRRECYKCGAPKDTTSNCNTS